MTMLLNCADITARGLVEWYLADRLTPDEVETFESHYLRCDRCQQDIRLGVAVRAVLRKPESEARPARPHDVPAEVTLPIAIGIALTEPNSS